MNVKKLLIFIGLTAIVASANAQGLGLRHVKGIHTVGVRGGTGWGDTFIVGISHQYYFHKQWSYVTHIDYERGMFNKSGFNAVNLMPGVEGCVWNPTTWLYLHLTGNAILGWDFWQQKDMVAKDNGFAVGVALGFNLEFYAMPELSFTIAAQQGWKYSFLKNGDYNYFCPLFSAGIKYNIR